MLCLLTWNLAGFHVSWRLQVWLPLVSKGKPMPLAGESYIFFVHFERVKEYWMWEMSPLLWGIRVLLRDKVDKANAAGRVTVARGVPANTCYRFIYSHYCISHIHIHDSCELICIFLELIFISPPLSRLFRAWAVSLRGLWGSLLGWSQNSSLRWPLNLWFLGEFQWWFFHFLCSLNVTLSLFLSFQAYHTVISA